MLTRERAASPRGTGSVVASRRLRWAAAALGLIGAALALAVPLLPVVQQTAVITWGSDGDTTALNAPLAAFAPQRLTATVPCAGAASLDARTPGRATLLATVPPGSADQTARGMRLQLADGMLTVISRGQALGTTALPDPGGAQPCAIEVASTDTRTTVAAGGFEFVTVSGDVRPQVTGVYTDLRAAADPVAGLGVRITPDTRFQTVPHEVKVAAMVLAGLAVLASLVLLHRLDLRTGRRAPRLAARDWWRPTPRDVTVVAILGVWLVIGTMTSDDGYILTMVRTADEMGYLGNYYRWLNVPEAPFSWPYELTALWAQVSTSPPWLRLPAFGMAVVSWLLLSRQLLPRLGPRMRSSRAAGWAAAAVFLAFWLPYNNGLRPEPVVAIGALLTWCAVERAVVLRRIAPLAVGLLVAALTVAATPTGLIALAPFLVSLRPIVRILSRHAAVAGWPAVLAPMLGAGLVVLALVFRDQTLATVIEGSRIRTAIGPSMSWFEEIYRYDVLFSSIPDGALTRRFPVLVLLLCLATTSVVLLRRGGIPGAAQGPSRRLIGIAALCLALLALTPTKWTHHFGSFAAIGGALGALTALATNAGALRSAGNRWWFVAGLLAIGALAFTGPNAPWYASKFGVLWNDRAPTLFAFPINAALLILAALVALIAVIEGLRHEPGGPPPVYQSEQQRRRALLLGSVPLVAACGAMVAFQVGIMGSAILVQADSYSLGAANLARLTGSTSCGLSDAVLVERNRSAGALTPLPAQGVALADQPGFAGFVRGRLPPPRPDTGLEQATGSGDASRTSQGATAEADNPVSTPPPGIGAGTALPFWSSYSADGLGTGEARTRWYRVPPAARSGELPVVVAVAGRLGSATPLVAEFGRRTPGGVATLDEVSLGERATDAPPGWRDYRVAAPSGDGMRPDVVRLTAGDTDVTPAGWLAFSAPRVPRLAPMTRVVGRDTPVFLDWPVSFVHPCLQPLTVRNGIAQVPAYRVTADDRLAGQSEGWSSAAAGGPLGWIRPMAEQQELPTYLEGAWDTDWGQLVAIRPLRPGDDTPAVRTGRAVRSGWWSPGPLRPTGGTEPVSPLGGRTGT